MANVIEALGNAARLGRMDKPLLAVTGGLILFFCLLALVGIELLSSMVDAVPVSPVLL